MVRSVQWSSVISTSSAPLDRQGRDAEALGCPGHGRLKDARVRLTPRRQGIGTHAERNTSAAFTIVMIVIYVAFKRQILNGPTDGPVKGLPGVRRAGSGIRSHCGWCQTSN